MEIKNTVGYTAKTDIRKSYIIHTTCGTKFYAEADGSQGYICNGVKYKSVKDIKAAIADGSISNEGDDEGDDEAPAEISTAEGVDTWDCVHPCALLVVLQNTFLQGCHEKQVLKTLDNYGWLDEQGKPDIARAKREVSRVDKLNKKQEDGNDN